MSLAEQIAAKTYDGSHCTSIDCNCNDVAAQEAVEVVKDALAQPLMDIYKAIERQIEAGNLLSKMMKEAGAQHRSEPTVDTGKRLRELHDIIAAQGLVLNSLYFAKKGLVKINASD